MPISPLPKKIHGLLVVKVSTGQQLEHFRGMIWIWSQSWSWRQFNYEPAVNFGASSLTFVSRRPPGDFRGDQRQGESSVKDLTFVVASVCRFVASPGGEDLRNLIRFRCIITVWAERRRASEQIINESARNYYYHCFPSSSWSWSSSNGGRGGQKVYANVSTLVSEAQTSPEY